MKLSTRCEFGAVMVLSLLIRSTFCASSTDAKNLREKLFVTDGYDKKIRPIHNQSEAIVVSVSLYLLAINELNEATESLKTTGYLWITWYDDLLQWDPSEFGGLDFYHWPQGEIWKHDVSLKNSFLDYKELGLKSLNVYVDSDGFIQWYPFQVFQSTCSINIKYFPFDEQVCELNYIAWSYSINQVYMGSSDDGIELFEYEPNSVWDLIDTSYYVDSVYEDSSVVFRIKIRRKPLHVLLSVIMPIIMLAISNIFVFVLPCESGEKASYAMTAFLAFAVFLSIVSTTFPGNSEVVPIISIYLIIQTLQSTVISLIALTMIRIVTYDDDNTPVPKCLQSVLTMIRCIPCRNRKIQNKVSDVGNLQEKGHSHDKSEGIDDLKDKSPTEVKYSDYSWKQIVKMFDKIFFVFFSLILIVSTMTFFMLASVNHKNYQ